MTVHPENEPSRPAGDARATCRAVGQGKLGRRPATYCSGEPNGRILDAGMPGVGGIGGVGGVDRVGARRLAQHFRSEIAQPCSPYLRNQPCSSALRRVKL